MRAAPKRALRASDLMRRNLTKSKTMHASRVGNRSRQALTSPPEPKERRERVITRKQANTTAVVRRNRPTSDNKKLKIFETDHQGSIESYRAVS
jgi:hypothetical protein